MYVLMPPTVQELLMEMILHLQQMQHRSCYYHYCNYSVDVTTAVSGGSITLGGAGTVSDRGVCWSTTTGPLVGGSHTSDGIGTGSFPSTVTPLQPGTKYYVRAYATNDFGTGYGTELSFNTKVADQEGNKYNTVNIGTQVWMSENLKTAHYNNGTAIGTIGTDIWADTVSSYQWPSGGNEANVAAFGRLYNFFAVTDPRGVCPTGWHVPSDAEWTTLSTYLSNNGFAFSGIGQPDIAKSMASTSGWTASAVPGDIGNNQATNNTSGFNALPTGFRNGDGLYQEIGASTYFWSSSRHIFYPNPVVPSSAWYRALQYQFNFMGRNDYATFDGFPTRCVK